MMLAGLMSRWTAFASARLSALTRDPKSARLARSVRSPRVVLTAVVVAALLGSGTTAPASTRRVSGACGRPTANKLIHTLPIWPAASHYLALDQVLCMDFTGDGRADLVVGVWTAMNHGAHYWAAFRNSSSHGWARVAYSSDCCGGHNRYGGMGIGIRRSGKRFVVSQPIYLSSDPACCPSGGTKSAAWVWTSHGLEHHHVAHSAPRAARTAASEGRLRANRAVPGGQV
jgi:hypothetical protein